MERCGADDGPYNSTISLPNQYIRCRLLYTAYTYLGTPDHDSMPQHLTFLTGPSEPQPFGSPAKIADDNVMPTMRLCEGERPPPARRSDQAINSVTSLFRSRFPQLAIYSIPSYQP